MKILYIDNRRYGHNADLHIDFISYMHKKKYHRVIGFGKFLHLYLPESIIPNMERPGTHLLRILSKYKPDLILTYNCNGSSYEIGHDNINHYKWISNTLSKVNIPKFHITTDYCRSGFRQEQADWFADIGYSASIFRHRIALEHECSVDKHWLPFSVDKKLYEKSINKKIKEKLEVVGFLGAAHNSSKKLYRKRISAINYLLKRNMMRTSKVLDDKFTRRILTGESYVKFFTKNLFNLTCGGTCNFITAKYFQIPASYSMLICSDTDGLDIFPKDCYIKFDRSNLNKMMEDINFHIKNKDITLEKINKMHNFVINNHSHHNRILEMTEIFKRYV